MRSPRRDGLSSAFVSNGTTTVVCRALRCICTAIDAPMTRCTKGTNCSANRRSTTRGSCEASVAANSSMYGGTPTPTLLIAAVNRACFDGKWRRTAAAVTPTSTAMSASVAPS
ncbi:MAG: hypothetical protein QOH21_276 [Acidobacteriota bacterium]|nr:hypothetical protein [Acidobacteriota bacterium]